MPAGTAAQLSPGIAPQVTCRPADSLTGCLLAAPSGQAGPSAESCLSTGYRGRASGGLLPVGDGARGRHAFEEWLQFHFVNHMEHRPE